MAAQHINIACVISLLIAFTTAGTEVILDVSNGYVRAGLAGDQSPTEEIPNTAMTYGEVSNWSDMEGIFREIFDDELNINPEEHPIVLTDLPLQPSSYREEITRIMFETFNVPKLYIVSSAVCSVLASGQFTGTILEITDGATYIVPIYNGYYADYTMERLIEPSFDTAGLTSIAIAVASAIGKAQWDERTELYANIVISGENAPDGIADNLRQQILNRKPDSVPLVNVVQPSGSQYLSYTGAGMMVTQYLRGANANDFYVTRDEYDASGKSIANRKFFAKKADYHIFINDDEGDQNEIMAFTSDQLFIIVLTLGLFFICQMVIFVYKLKECWDEKMEIVDYEQVRIDSETDIE